MDTTPSPNFAFLAGYDARLVAAPTSAERALAIDDAVGSLGHFKDLGSLGDLKDSILVRVFPGQLIVEDPGDEPVSLLLERSKDVREAAHETKSPAWEKIHP